jgi:SpoVK/Ycf46/Vps4 family AAA+-type ATPase
MKILKSAIGGVLFIDEVYSLGAGSKSDVFSKGVIDTINKFLTEHKHEFVCIIAGYEDEIHENFFSVNKGLKSRFPIVFTIDEYTPEELYSIFELKVESAGWTVNPDDVSCIKTFFRDIVTKDKAFPYFGRDVEVLFTQVKICHTDRVFWKTTDLKSVTIQDVKNGYAAFTAHKKKKEKPKEILSYFL